MKVVGIRKINVAFGDIRRDVVCQYHAGAICYDG